MCWKTQSYLLNRFNWFAWNSVISLPWHCPKMFPLSPSSTQLFLMIRCHLPLPAYNWDVFLEWKTQCSKMLACLLLLHLLLMHRPAGKHKILATNKICFTVHPNWCHGVKICAIVPVRLHHKGWQFLKTVVIGIGISLMIFGPTIYDKLKKLFLYWEKSKLNLILLKMQPSRLSILELSRRLKRGLT